MFRFFQVAMDVLFTPLLNHQVVQDADSAIFKSV